MNVMQGSKHMESLIDRSHIRRLPCANATQETFGIGVFRYFHDVSSGLCYHQLIYSHFLMFIFSTPLIISFVLRFIVLRIPNGGKGAREKDRNKERVQGREGARSRKQVLRKSLENKCSQNRCKHLNNNQIILTHFNRRLNFFTNL